MLGARLAAALQSGKPTRHKAAMTQVSSADQAIAAILRRDEDGFALYEKALRDAELATVPAGLHLGMLRQADRHDDARRLAELALRYGADLAPRAGSFLGAPPDVAAAEYEALIERGEVNARMIYRYLLALARLGRWAKHARILAAESLFRIVTIDEAIAVAADALLLEVEEQAQLQESAQSVRNMRMKSDLEHLGHPAAQDLLEEISEQTASYLADWRASDHPLSHLVPEDFDVLAWGLISRGEGYNVPHIHGEGWATGVFYPRSAEGDGGELVVGRPEGAPGSDSDWGARTIKPQAGILLLFPSYYTHWTIPLNRPGLRTSVAFDVVSRREPVPSFPRSSAS